MRTLDYSEAREDAMQPFLLLRAAPTAIPRARARVGSLPSVIVDTLEGRADRGRRRYPTVQAIPKLSVDPEIALEVQHQRWMRYKEALSRRRSAARRPQVSPHWWWAIAAGWVAIAIIAVWCAR